MNRHTMLEVQRRHPGVQMAVFVDYNMHQVLRIGALARGGTDYQRLA